MEKLLGYELFPHPIDNQMAMKICDFQYRKYFYQRDDGEIEENFRMYKIECWADADKAINSTKLLDID